MITNQRIGVDIGNVIIGGAGTDTFFSDDFLKTPHVPGFRRGLRALQKAGNELFFISKCGPAVEAKTRLWLHENSVLWFLQLDEDRLHFTRTRIGKVPVALSLGLDVFIDDRPDICIAMESAGIRAVRFKSWIDTLKELAE